MGIATYIDESQRAFDCLFGTCRVGVVDVCLRIQPTTDLLLLKTGLKD